MKKKILLSILSLILVTGICFAGLEYKFNEEYIRRFEICGPYTQVYEYEYATKEKEYPYVHIKSTDSVIGIRNGKCATRTTIFCKELNADIMIINCAFTQEQRTALVRKMKAAKTDPIAQKQLKNNIQEYVKNRPDICTVRDIIKEADKYD